ncbi:aldo/keto reductase [Cecembia lonarensis]|uniref:2,5-diketo-D-gluconic acid reductase A n=1 Tax=Cecembia lonarensis (strain CCUG 58316 / KCTC 22772 / LW9) TaxID=1225176 RepID=K1LFE4_CECL9|nr:aldo/keto reductase [Cecembia lonarensis]EKB50927.1 2,5-diketo-D-gluconic acid reductase A [Cecembia lonarensis LW9]
MKTLEFRNGDKLPMIGLGTWKSKPGEVYQAVLWAIEAGYRHIDCAAIYDNEKEVGKALDYAFKNNWVKREELFITSKLWNSAHRLEDVELALAQTLKDLRLDYLDLYLIHWPVSFKPGVGFAQTREEFYTYSDVPLSQTWQGMEQCLDIGLVRHIGVSNFNISKLKEIIDNNSIIPEMNQIELHPFLQQNKLVGFCKEHGILLTAYSPLGSSDRSASIKKADEPSLLNNSTILDIADNKGVSAAQILIAYTRHRNIAVIPKSVNKERIAQNLASLEVALNEKEMTSLNDIGINYRFVDGSFFTSPQSPYSLDDLWERE